MFTLGLAVTLAMILGAATAALAAVPGDPFRLGKINRIDEISILVGSDSGALLRVNNEGGGPALDLRVRPGEAPMNVNSATRVNGLNADQLDGQGANDFIAEDKIYKVTDAETGTGGGTDVEVSADCDPGDRILGGGGGNPFPDDILRVSDPIGNSWRVIAQDNANGSAILAQAICADFPPLR